MTGSSIASRDAAPWITDFLNAAYYRRAVSERKVDDLRLAFAILTTFWYRRRSPRRLRISDVTGVPRRVRRTAPGHRADSARAPDAGAVARRCRRAGRRLVPLRVRRRCPARLGDRVPPSGARRLRPERRMAVARVGAMPPESGPPEMQTWHTYPPVEMTSVEVAGADSLDPRPGPITRADRSSAPRSAPAAARLRRSRSRRPRAPIGSASCSIGGTSRSRVGTPDDPQALESYFAELRPGGDTARSVAPRARSRVGFDLARHRACSSGPAADRLILFAAAAPDAGRRRRTSDPMPWHLAQSYRVAGRAAEHAFWGEGDVARLSMLHQLARQIG